jgi:hypothetical protein
VSDEKATENLFLGHQRTTGLELLHSARLKGKNELPVLSVAAQAIDAALSKDTIRIWIEKKRAANSVFAKLDENASVAVGFSACQPKLKLILSGGQVKGAKIGIERLGLALATQQGCGEQREPSSYGHSRRLTDGR